MSVDNHQEAHLKGLGLALMRRGMRSWLVADMSGPPSLHFQPDRGSNTVTCGPEGFLFRVPGGYEWWSFGFENADACARAIGDLMFSLQSESDLARSNTPVIR